MRGRAPFKPEPETADRVQYFADALSERASALTTAAQRHRQKLCDAADIDWSAMEDDDDLMDEWLEERVAGFEELHPQFLSTITHLGHIVATASDATLDANAVPFPKPKPMMRSKWEQARPSDLDGVRAEARGRVHKEDEVAMWGKFDEQSFVLPRTDVLTIDGGGADIGLIVVDEPYERDVLAGHPWEREYGSRKIPWGHSPAEPDHTMRMLIVYPGACREFRREWEAGLARSPEELRPWLYGEAALAPLDMSFPEGQGAAWSRWGASSGARCIVHQSFYGECMDVISRDLCTEEQLRVISARQDPNFWQPERVRARALKRKVLPGFLQAAPEMLDRESAYSKLAQLREADKARAIADYEQRGEEGARQTSWPTAGHWPKFAWAPHWLSLQRQSAERLAAARAAPPKPDVKPQLFCHLVNAAGRGDVAKVQHILKQGCRPRMSRDLFFRTCSVKKQGLFRFPVISGESEGDGKELLLCQMNGDQCLLRVDPLATLQDVLDRISSACGTERSQLARHFLRFMTPSGEVVQDNSIPLLTLFADGQWALTMIVLNRGSVAAAEILLSLLEAVQGISTIADGLRCFGPALVEAACEIGNEAVVEILSEQPGLDAERALMNVLSRMEVIAESDDGASISALQEPRIMKSLECLLKAWFRSTDDSLRGGYNLYRFQRVSRALLPILKHDKWNTLLSHDLQLWAGLLPRCQFNEIMEILPQSLLASRSFILHCLAYESGWMILARASAELRRDEEILITAVTMTPKAIPLVPAGSWSNKLALAAMEHEPKDFEVFLKDLPAVEWTEELAWKACRAGEKIQFRALPLKLAGWLPEGLWSEGLALKIVERAGFDALVSSSLIPKFLLASRSFIWQVLKSKSGYKALTVIPEDLLSDLDLLRHAMQCNPKMAAMLIPSKCWNTELALVAAENCTFDFVLSLPVSEWTDELARKALTSGASGHQLIEVIPESAWSEELALNLVRECYSRAAVIPARFYSTSFILKLIEASWHSLLYAPLELLEKDFVREALTRAMQKSSESLSRTLTDNCMDLMSVREHLELAEALASKPLFRKELLETSLTKQKIALNLQLRFSMLASIRLYADASPDLTMEKLRNDIEKDFSQFRARSLAQVKDIPPPCLALLHAVRCLLEEKLCSMVPVRDTIDWLKDNQLYKKLTSMGLKDVQDIPLYVATYVSEAVSFLPREGSGPSLCLWALDNFHSAKSISALAGWVLGVLQLKFNGSSPCKSSKHDVESLRMRIDMLTKTEQILEADSSSCGNPRDYTSQIKMDVTGLHRDLREKAVIVEGLQLLEHRLPTVISNINARGSGEAWCSALATGFGKVLEQAKALKEDAAAASHNLDSLVSSLDMERRAAAATGSSKDSESPKTLRRSRSLSFSASTPKAILSDAREFLESSSPPSKLTRPFLIMARQAATKPMLTTKLPPLTSATSSIAQLEGTRNRSHSIGGVGRHTWSNGGAWTNATVDCLREGDHVGMQSSLFNATL